MARFWKKGQAENALELYEEMREEGIPVNNRTIVSAVQACGILASKEQAVFEDGSYMKKQALNLGKRLHDLAHAEGFAGHPFVASALITMYSKCGSLVHAASVFDELTDRDLVSWNAMLTAYTEHGDAEKTFQLYEDMQTEGLQPDAYTNVSALQACSIVVEKRDAIGHGYLTEMKWLARGRAIHAEVQRKYCIVNKFIGSALISMYGKFGCVADAWNVFGRLSDPDVVSWNAMLGAYAEQCQAEKALQLYEQMCDTGVLPNSRSLLTALQACGNLAEKEADALEYRSGKSKYLQHGKALHCYAMKEGLLSDLGVCSAIIMMYGKCRSIYDAQRTFDGISEHGTLSWNAMLTVYVHQGEAEKAVQLFEDFSDSVDPDSRTFMIAIQACDMLVDEEDVLVEGQTIKGRPFVVGKTLHAHALAKGHIRDIFVCSALISLYGKCRTVADAELLFSGLREQHCVPWNAMLAVYVENSQAKPALNMYIEMQEKAVSPDNGTFVTVLQACRLFVEKESVLTDGRFCEVSLLGIVQTIHTDAWKLGYHSDVYVASNLITVYGKCGRMADAWNVFESLPKKNVVTWTAMLAAFVEQGQVENALQLFEQMQCDGPTPDAITLICISQACSKTGNLTTLRQIHKSHFSSSSISLGNTLISSFGRCGSMIEARSVFDSLPEPDPVSWSALIAGYARQGDYGASLHCYENMILAGVKPSAVTFLSLMTACNHTGLVEKGMQLFETMTRKHCLIPSIEHYGTLIDLLGRAGRFPLVEEVLSEMEMHPDFRIWVSLLAACQKHGNVALGERAFEGAVHLQPKDASAYVLLCNIYADAGMWDKAEMVYEWRQQAGAWKEAGQSWLQHENKTHTFGAMRQSSDSGYII